MREKSKDKNISDLEKKLMEALKKVGEEGNKREEAKNRMF